MAITTAVNKITLLRRARFWAGSGATIARNKRSSCCVNLIGRSSNTIVFHFTVLNALTTTQSPFLPAMRAVNHNSLESQCYLDVDCDQRN